MIARGQYVLFLDPDDLLRPTALEKLVLMASEVVNVGNKGKDRGGALALRTGLIPFLKNKNKPNKQTNNANRNRVCVPRGGALWQQARRSVC